MSNFLKKYKDIYDGWKNDVFTTPEIAELAHKRSTVCATCPLNIDNTCSKKVTGPVVSTFTYEVDGTLRKEGELYKGCGCPLDKKTKAPNTQCPLNRW